MYSLGLILFTKYNYCSVVYLLAQISFNLDESKESEDSSTSGSSNFKEQFIIHLLYIFDAY